MRGHLVAWLLGYSVTERAGIAEKKRIERTSVLSFKIYSRKMLGYFGSVREVLKIEVKKEEIFDLVL